MRRDNLFSAGVACLFVLALFVPSCVFISADNDADPSTDDPSGNSEDCCREVRVCETECDEHGCYDDCTVETRCPEACNQQCTGDLDCPKNTVCLDGVCTERNFNNTGTGGLCQSCSTAYDCAEPDARCVRLYFERTPAGGPKVCATDCETSADCPWDFECIDEPNTPAVCVPREEFGSTDRVCPDEPSTSDDVECFSSDNCAPGESCVANECIAPDGECTRDADCGQGAVCRNFQCVDSSEPECVNGENDCASDQICVDGQCEERSSSGMCTENEDCRGDAVCVDGDCLSRCQDRSDCKTSSEICRQGLCKPIECRFNSDCQGGEVCVDATCQTSCQGDGDCESGYVCDRAGNFCKRDPNVECRSDAECLSGEACQQGECTTICSCNQECASGEVCNKEATSDSNTGLCREQDQSARDPACSTDCQCPSGQTCQNGTCTDG